MDCAALATAKRITPKLFGDTDIAGGIPSGYRPLPSAGPVYFEGRLILALSFQGGENARQRGEMGALCGEDAAAGADEKSSNAGEDAELQMGERIEQRIVERISPHADEHAALRCDACAAPRAIECATPHASECFATSSSKGALCANVCNIDAYEADACELDVTHILAGAGKLLDELRLWDVLSDSWFEPSPIILRCTNGDVVLVDGIPVFRGVVDNACDVAIVPGWDSTCTRINNQYYLEWISKRRETQCSER